MASWWDNVVDFIGNLGSGGNVGYAPQFETPRVVGPQYMPTTGQSFTVPTTGTRMVPRSSPRSIQGQSALGQSTLIPENLDRAGRMGGANAAVPQLSDPSYFGMSPDELLSFILGGSGGGGGVNTSGYNALLDDIASRQAGLESRRGEQQAYLSSLFDAAEARAIADREALAAAIDSQLASDAERRAAEIGLIRGADTERLATANAAREALGVAPGADLSSQVAQNAAAGVGASGSVAERDARILQSIGQQQLNREIGGLTPIEASYLQQLNRGYEDRLSQLASERANVMAQIASARASGGGRGASPSEIMNALQFTQSVFGPGEQAALPGVGGYLQGLGQSVPQQLIPDLIALGDQVLQTATRSNVDPTSLAGAQELINMLVTSNPAAASLLNYPGATGIVLDYVMEASK